MSWSGFKKTMDRAKTQVMMKAGQVDRTIDRDFECELRRFRTMETAALKVLKCSKGYLDSLRALAASQIRIAETIDAFYGESGNSDGISRAYKKTLDDLDAKAIKALDGPYRVCVLDPISGFCDYFAAVNEVVRKHEHKRTDYDGLRARVRRLVERPDKDSSRLPQAERDADSARRAYEALNTQLLTELPKLIELRVPLLDPSFEALVKIQLRFCTESYAKLAQIQQQMQPSFGLNGSSGETCESLRSNVEEVLQEIRDLSIAGTV